MTHHQRVRFRLLKDVPDPGAATRQRQLIGRQPRRAKALLPYYAGR